MGVLVCWCGFLGFLACTCDSVMLVCSSACAEVGWKQKNKQEWQVQTEEKEREKNDRSQVWNVNEIKFWCASACESGFVFQSCLSPDVLTENCINNHTHSQMLRIFLRVCASACLAPCLSLRTMIQSEISFHLLRCYRYHHLTHRDLGGGLIS